MATRADYRTDLSNKLLALEDGSYGDFEYSTAELDTYLDLAVARLFPAVYSRQSASALTPTTYGSLKQGYVSDPSIIYERVYLVEDGSEMTPLTGWQTRPDRVIGIDTEAVLSVNVYWVDGFTLPSNDVDDAGLANIYTPLVVLGALIEALEARQDTGVRGDPQPTGVFFETQLLDRLRPRYDDLKRELAMSLPGMVF